MQNKLIELDRTFSDHFKRLFEIQKELLDIYNGYSFDLDSDEITESIHDRMQAFWYFNVHNTHLLLKGNITPSASDFFTQTCMLFFKAYFENRYKVKVCSERNISKGKKIIRPDISIWNEKENNVIAVIELKVNDGWKRSSMLDHLFERRRLIISEYPSASFHVIAFWDFPNSPIRESSTNYIGLYEFCDKGEHKKTSDYVEHTMKSIEKAVESYYREAHFYS